MGHNFLQYDRIWLTRLAGISIDPDKVLDTLILSKLLKSNIEDGHSLDAWGQRLNFPKIIHNDFSQLTPELVRYCKNDVELNCKLLTFLLSKLRRKDHAFDRAIEIEHRMALVAEDMHNNGFSFDVPHARKLRQEIKAKIDELDAQIAEAFPPKSRLIRVVTPRLTKFGTLSRVGFPKDWRDLSFFQEDAPFSLVSWEPFNPGSPKQIVERLNAAGWKPYNKTKGHIDAEKAGEDLTEYKIYGWKVDEENLSTLPDDAPSAARTLVERLFLAGRLRTLDEWLGCVKEDSKVHARFSPLGTWTHRWSHSNPNLGNIAAPKSIKYKSKHIADEAIRLGKEMRSLWKVSSDDYWLVGTDATGIQLRIFAHYINEPTFTEALIHGDNKLGTDAHSINANALGIPRDSAKTFIYALLLGAGDSKLGEVIGGSSRDGRRARKTISEMYPGYGGLRERQIRRDATRGYFVGFDGRLITCDSEHLMLAGYLQAGEAIIMKYANELWRKKLNDLGVSYKQVNFVHDEWQTEVHGDKDLAIRVGHIQADSIREVGETFKLNCPMAGEFRVGKNWYETH